MDRRICELCDTPEWLQGISRQILSVSGCIGGAASQMGMLYGQMGQKAIQEYQKRLRLNKEQYIEFLETAKRLFDAGSLDVDSRFLRKVLSGCFLPCDKRLYNQGVL